MMIKTVRKDVDEKKRKVRKDIHVCTIIIRLLHLVKCYRSFYSFYVLSMSDFNRRDIKNTYMYSTITTWQKTN